METLVHQIQQEEFLVLVKLLVQSNVMDYITIASTGDATDFGDLMTAVSYGGVASNGHGGLVGG